MRPLIAIALFLLTSCEKDEAICYDETAKGTVYIIQSGDNLTVEYRIKSTK